MVKVKATKPCGSPKGVLETFASRLSEGFYSVLGLFLTYSKNGSEIQSQKKYYSTIYKFIQIKTEISFEFLCLTLCF